ncbi:MAG: PEP-CTERM sorting domain-containing protein [Pseudomonadota bacterium]
MTRLRMTGAAAVLALGASAASATPVTYDGIEFPGGDASFADMVHAWGFGDPAPTDANYMDPQEALGAPDYISPNGSFTLGSGGFITLRFTDNALSGSGDSTPDLHVFEIGPDVEKTFVEISVDGADFLSVGAVDGSTSSLDIDQYLAPLEIDPFTRFSYVRLTDDPESDGQTGDTVGADIDAVGAIASTPPDPEQAPSVPLPGALPLLAGGLAGLAAWRGAARGRRG